MYTHRMSAHAYAVQQRVYGRGKNPDFHACGRPALTVLVKLMESMDLMHNLLDEQLSERCKTE